MSSYFPNVQALGGLQGIQRDQRNLLDRDLNTTLDEGQRGDLTILVAQITESMRKTLTDNSGTPHIGNYRRPTPDSDGISVLGTNDTNGTLKNRQEASVANAREILIKRKALQHFDKWKDSILFRINEIVDKSDDRKRSLLHDAIKAGDLRAESQREPVDAGDSTTRLSGIYAPIETPLLRLDQEDKRLVLHSLLLLALSLKHYSALSRVLLLNVASSLGLSLKDLNDNEARVARGLLDAAIEFSADEEKRKRAEQNSSARRWKVGIASVAGAALIGITGGLAAPLVAAGIGTIMGGLGLGATAVAGYLGALAGSGVIVGSLFGAYGGRMTGRMMDRYAREVEDFAFIPLREPQRDYKDEIDAARQDHRLRVTIGVTGWAMDEDDIVAPWRSIRADSEVVALRWELEALINLGNAIRVLVTSAAWTFAGWQAISRTILAQLLSAVMLPMSLLKIASIVDNPFSIAKTRADKAGVVLADALIHRAQGERPVTLVGYSLGSRVVASCLQSLAKRGAYGLIESAILIGSPIPSSSSYWRIMRSVVSGRLINVFSKNDAVLALLYRASSAQFGVAGLQSIMDAPRVENFDASEIVNGHLQYRHLIGRILADSGFEEVDIEEIDKQKIALQLRDLEEESERIKNQQLVKVVATRADGATENQPIFDYETEALDDEAKRLEIEVQNRTQEKLMHRKMKQMKIEILDNE